MNGQIPHRPFRSETDYAQMLPLHRDIFGAVRGPICCTAGELEWWRFQEVDPDGRFAAFCTAWLDEQNRVGLFEPVECLPEFRRRGLTRAMMCEGMRRLKRLGAEDVCIVNRSENTAAKWLYESIGFQMVGRVLEWRKPIR